MTLPILKNHPGRSYLISLPLLILAMSFLFVTLDGYGGKSYGLTYEDFVVFDAPIFIRVGSFIFSIVSFFAAIRYSLIMPSIELKIDDRKIVVDNKEIIELKDVTSYRLELLPHYDNMFKLIIFHKRQSRFFLQMSTGQKNRLIEIIGKERFKII